MFLSGPRCSSTEINHNIQVKKKDNFTTELTKLALNSQPKNSNKSPHETVEEFFLLNDSSTVATELPVFINPEELRSSYSQINGFARPQETSLDVDEPITGHIDTNKALLCE